MFFCWHSWGKWETFRQTVDDDFGTPILYQKAECAKCGKVKLRART